MAEDPQLKDPGNLTTDSIKANVGFPTEPLQDSDELPLLRNTHVHFPRGKSFRRDEMNL